MANGGSYIAAVCFHGFDPGMNIQIESFENGEQMVWNGSADLVTRWTLDHDPSPEFQRSVLADSETVYAA